VLACEFVDESDYDGISTGDNVVLNGLHVALRTGDGIDARIGFARSGYVTGCRGRQVHMARAGGVVPMLRNEFAGSRRE
jgi:aconitate hydratase